MKKYRETIIEKIKGHLGGGDKWDIKDVYKVYMKLDKLFGEKGELRKASVRL